MQVQRSLKKALKNPQTVTSLDLRQEKPTLLFKEIEQFTNLEYIDFSNCTTLNWADACAKLAKLPKLATIKAFNADIQTLPEELGLLTALTSIDFSGNGNLKILPETFSKLTKLEEITMYGSGLESLPQTPWNFPNLRTLSLGKNKLQLFPEEFFTGLPGLQAITISDNQLQSLPESICHLKNLASLLAGNNLFQVLPQNFAALTHLETLWLDSCPGINYEEELLKMTGLPIKNLSLPGNNLSELPAPFKYFKILEYLNINSNPLTDIWKLLEGLSHLPLRELDVRFTGCEMISIDQARLIIPTLQQIVFDTRTEEQYASDIYSYVSGHFEAPKKGQRELVMNTGIMEYLQFVSGQQKEIFYIQPLADAMPDTVRLETIFPDKANYATFTIKNIEIADRMIYAGSGSEPVLRIETIAVISVGGVIEQNMFSASREINSIAE